eukprot:maker-scaffold1197_size55989-snap-gene-0.14 protein:Tk09665 transcript:maker-scaffold1197_size55989-snap-gene-0.14-mRNA-1 annotation:"hypothetical protein L798_07656"
MTEPELRLDPAIRIWVFLPIVLITFLVGIIRHYVSVLLTSAKTVDISQVRDSQILIRSRMLRENSKYLPKPAFLMRRHFLNNAEDGILMNQVSTRAAPPNPMTDPSMMTDMLKGNLTNVLPMIVIGGWINWHFSGFVTTKVPFPLTLRFKPMLQRGIELMSLDASWVSSASWYFLNVFGLRSIYALVLGENNAADQSRVMQDQMTMQAGGMPQDPRQAFKGEWEALQVTEHQFALKNIETDMMAVVGPTGDDMYHQNLKISH